MIARSVRLATASIAAVPVLFAVATSAHALTCAVGQFTLSEAYEAADSVVLGLVTECEEEVSSEPYAVGGADCSFVSTEVLKESVPARDYGGLVSSSPCGLSVQVGSRYLLFLDGRNRPMDASAPLDGEPFQTREASGYLEILRQFRAGQVNDLAEPWFIEEAGGYCFIRHRIKGHEMSFSRRVTGAPLQAEPEWTRDATDGEAVYRMTGPLLTEPEGVIVGEVERVVSNEVPDRAEDVLFLSVSLQDEWPAPVRRATLSVDDRTWPLNRMETNLLLTADGTRHQIVEYWADGETAEQILSAMEQPSGIVVSARVVLPDEASGTSDAFQPDEKPVEATAPIGDSVSPSPRGRQAAGSSAIPDERVAGSYGFLPLPQPRLRLESRSTQLPGAIRRFQACYTGEPGG